ncbi:uncharacterized protein LOC120706189 isoform X2 [Panicum virgatum]|uniref:Uncharacterized protein n=1 Tax=Panicum virgatum TaxID=38727 RepID=A0A8T0SCZ3_PANVG|nr:uncharacterized protein LOC120706189 isoform X2 [Panicum virgatum]KAG2596087.1 hypothetical protein PVAP13_5KG139400 [Panicum virgatum]
MRRSPRPRPTPPPTPPPAPAPSQAMVAPAAVAGGCGGEEQEQEQEQEFDICNDEGFVYKVPSGLYPDAAPSSTQAAAGPDPEIAGLRRRRRALLRLRAKRLRDLSRWEALASELLAPPPAPRPPASETPPASPNTVAATATAASASVLDDLIAQADLQAELLRKASQLCDEINALCDAHEAAIVDDLATLPVWGNPRELMTSLYSPDGQNDPGGMIEGNGGFQSLDSQQGRRPIGVVSAVERVKLSGDKQIQNPSQCKRCLQFGCTGKTCCETHAELGDELPSPVLTENRKRKVAASPSSSNSVAAQAPDKPKRQKAPRSKSTPSRTPGSTMKRKAASTPRAPDTSRSPGPTTRRRAAGRLASPRS